jgi:hypothetical protein
MAGAVDLAETITRGGLPWPGMKIPLPSASSERLCRTTRTIELFFGCPDEANPLQFLGVEDRGEKFAHVHFQLNVYKGRD